MAWETVFAVRKGGCLSAGSTLSREKQARLKDPSVLYRPILNYTQRASSFPSQSSPFPTTPHLPILRPHKICKRLWLLVVMMSIIVSVRVRVVGRADIVHFEDVAAFGAALDGAIAGHLSWGLVGGLCLGGGGIWVKERKAYGKPDRNVRVGRYTCASGILFVAEGSNDDRVVEGSWLRRAFISMALAGILCASIGLLVAVVSSKALFST